MLKSSLNFNSESDQVWSSLPLHLLFPTLNSSLHYPSPLYFRITADGRNRHPCLQSSLLKIVIILGSCLKRLLWITTSGREKKTSASVIQSPIHYSFYLIFPTLKSTISPTYNPCSTHVSNFLILLTYKPLLSPTQISSSSTQSYIFIKLSLTR